MSSIRAKLKNKLVDNGVEYKCQLCSITHWRDQKLSLHLDHIDGNRHNNDFSNLRFLCPNCHSLTSTYCGRNNVNAWHKQNYKVSDDELLDAMYKAKNVKAALESVGMAGADNYKRVYKLAKIYSLRHMMSPNDRALLIVHDLKKSDIDFSTWGWVQKASGVIGIKPQKVRQWLQRHYPEVLNSSYIR